MAYGMLTGIVGIFLNICLFAGKFIAGTISGSISITADAFNNLSDAGSSFVTLIGFKLAGAEARPGSSVWPWENRICVRIDCFGSYFVDGV